MFNTTENFFKEDKIMKSFTDFHAFKLDELSYRTTKGIIMAIKIISLIKYSANDNSPNYNKEDMLSNLYANIDDDIKLIDAYKFINIYNNFKSKLELTTSDVCSIPMASFILGEKTQLTSRTSNTCTEQLDNILNNHLLDLANWSHSAFRKGVHINVYGNIRHVASNDSRYYQDTKVFLDKMNNELYEDMINNIHILDLSHIEGILGKSLNMDESAFAVLDIKESIVRDLTALSNINETLYKQAMKRYEWIIVDKYLSSYIQRDILYTLVNRYVISNKTLSDNKYQNPHQEMDDLCLNVENYLILLTIMKLHWMETNGIDFKTLYNKTFIVPGGGVECQKKDNYNVLTLDEIVKNILNDVKSHMIYQNATTPTSALLGALDKNHQTLFGTTGLYYSYTIDKVIKYYMTLLREHTMLSFNKHRLDGKPVSNRIKIKMQTKNHRIKYQFGFESVIPIHLSEFFNNIKNYDKAHLTSPALNTTIGCESVIVGSGRHNILRDKTRLTLLKELTPKERNNYFKFELETNRLQALALDVKTVNQQTDIIKKISNVITSIWLNLDKYSESYKILCYMLDEKLKMLTDTVSSRDLHRERNSMLFGNISTSREWNY